MAPQFYRRHRRGCKRGHAEDSKSEKLEEGRRGWKPCACPIHSSGALKGQFNRQSTGEWEWDKADEAAASLAARNESGSDLTEYLS